MDERGYMMTIPVLLDMMPAPATELQLRQPFETQYVHPHNIAVCGVGAAQAHAKIAVFSPEYSLAGEPDYLFVYNGIVCGVIEMKTFWKVSKESVEEVLNGKRPVRTFLNDKRDGADLRISRGTIGY